MSVFAGRRGRIAARLAEAAFPAGERLPAPDINGLLAAAGHGVDRSAAARRALSSLLWWLELRYFMAHGRSFSSASLEKRSAFLRHHADSLLAGKLLRVLATPLRTAYLLDEGNLRRMNVRAAVEAPAALEPARWRGQVAAAADVDAPIEVECDVVVVGTGAGGAAAAYELASRGLAVVMIEEGHYYDRRDFSGRLAEVVPKLYRSHGATVSLGNTIIPIPIGRSVGGSTTINSGTCLRTPAPTLAEWRAEGLVDFREDGMRPYFESVEEMLRVRTADPRYVGEIGRVIAEGARQIGMHDARPLQRNAEGCDGQSLCQFGCPTDAKQSTNVSYVPRALERGAFLYTGFRVDRLLRDGDTVTGVVARGTGARRETVSLTVRARATVVAMGTLLTPNFLRANGVRHPWLGNNLSLHPAGAVTAWFPDRDFDHARAIPQGFGVFDLEDEGMMFEGGTVPFAVHGMFVPWQAEDFVRFAERYQQTAYFGIMVKDTSRGKVRRGLSRDLPLVTYSVNGFDFDRLKRGMDMVARMYLAAGAREVVFPGLTKMTVVHDERELDAFWRTNPPPRQFLLTAYHPLGTARIAASRERGVCDPAHAVWDVPGLYVMDGASVPTALGANPQVTIMAMATRAARMLAQRLGTE